MPSLRALVCLRDEPRSIGALCPVPGPFPMWQATRKESTGYSAKENKLALFLGTRSATLRAISVAGCRFFFARSALLQRRCRGSALRLAGADVLGLRTRGIVNRVPCVLECNMKPYPLPSLVFFFSFLRIVLASAFVRSFRYESPGFELVAR